MVFGVWCLVFGVWCLVFGVWRLVFGVWGLGFLVQVRPANQMYPLIFFLVVDRAVPARRRRSGEVFEQLVVRHLPPTLSQSPPWRQPRSKWMVSLVTFHANATSGD